jgi:hypothetical protein
MACRDSIKEDPVTEEAENQSVGKVSLHLSLEHGWEPKSLPSVSAKTVF